ncbi:MAG TPA: hypothetical protein VK255_02845 [Patescibacteria group bacterium]|nr:hypothetical protein [Patescibacteria group bacterium]
MNQKKIPTGIGVALIVIIVVTIGVLVWKYEKNQKESVQETHLNVLPKETIKNTSNYKNEGYKYEIEIPIGFSVKTGSLKDPDSLVNIISEQGNIPLFSIRAEISKFKDINDWIDDYQQKLAKITSYEGVKIDPPSILSKEETSLNGTEAIKIAVHNMPYSDYLVVMIKDKLIYTISYSGLLLTNEKNILKEQPINQENIRSEFQSKHREELDKIVSSFKFIK